MLTTKTIIEKRSDILGETTGPNSARVISSKRVRADFGPEMYVSIYSV